MGILIITCKDTDEITGRERTVVSHGIDMRTGKNVILSNETLKEFLSNNKGYCYFDENAGGWVIRDEREHGKK